MEPYPHHYSHRARPEEPTDSSLKAMVDELQQMVARLGAKIEDRCGGLENHVEIAEQCAEERLVSLEMSLAEQEVGHTYLAEQMGALKLELNRVNRGSLSVRIWSISSAVQASSARLMRLVRHGLLFLPTLLNPSEICRAAVRGVSSGMVRGQDRGYFPS
jgi:uncharacterized coiled-coil protein SlyX